MNRTSLIAMGMACATIAGGSILLANAQLGPIEPPRGPVADTRPSLEDLDQKADQMSADIASLAGDVAALNASIADCCPCPEPSFTGATIINTTQFVNFDPAFVTRVNFWLTDSRGSAIIRVRNGGGSTITQVYLTPENPSAQVEIDAVVANGLRLNALNLSGTNVGVGYFFCE